MPETPRDDSGALDATVTPVDAAPPAGAPDGDDLPEVRVARYRMAEEVGRGGLGRVLRARDLVLGRTVAIKELHTADEGSRRRFVREALVTSRLQHPSIVPVYEAGRWPDRSPFYAMKLVAGRPLSDVLEGKRSLAERLALVPTVLAVADAIAYAHSERIVHRDLKPHNVLVGEFGETVVIDWGLAKDLSVEAPPDEVGPYRAVASAEQTVAGSVLGTPAYMAPEQAAGDRVDERTDVYALGAMLYHVVAGLPPHGGGSMDEVLARILTGKITPLSEREPTAAPDLVAIVAKAMRVEPGDRYPSAAEMAGDLRRFTAGQLVGAHRYSIWQLITRWIRLHRAIATTVLVAVLVAAAGAAWFLVRERRLRGESERARVGAEHARDDARESEQDTARALARSLVEQGRRELIDHHPARAAAYLGAAYPSLADEPTMRFLIAAAIRDIERWRTTLVGHTSSVWSVAFSPDGQRVVTAGHDNTARVWDVASGSLVVALAGHTGSVSSAAFSPDGKRVVTDSDLTARVWDASTGAVIATMTGGPDFVKATFSLDGQRVVAASRDVARVWDAASGTLLATLEDAQCPFYSAAFSPDATRAVTPGATTCLWDVVNGKLLATLEGHTATVSSAAFSADGKLVVTASEDRTARIWEAATGKAVMTLAGHTDDVYSAAFSPGGQRVVTASADGTAGLWDAATGRAMAILEGGSEGVGAVAFTADGLRVLTTGGDTARIWDTMSGRPLVDLDGASFSPVFSPDGQWVASPNGNTARIWDASGAQELGTHAVVAEAFSPDGQGLLTSSDNASVATARFWDAHTGKPLMTLDGHPDDFDDTASMTGVDRYGVGAAAYSPDGQRVLIVSNTAGDVGIWDATTARRLATLDRGDRAIRSAAFSPDSQHVVTASGDVARIHDVASGKVQVTLEGHTAAVRTPSFSPDGKRVATASRDKSARLWDAATGKLLTIFDGHGDEVSSVAFSPDGRRVMTVSDDQKARVWDAETAALLATLEGVQAAEWSPDGQRVVTIGDPFTPLLWDAATGQLLATLEGHTGGVRSASFSPDGQRILTASADGTARIWDVATGKVLAILDGHAFQTNSAAFSPDGQRVVTTDMAGVARIWDVHLETRSPAEIAAIIAARVPWQIIDGQLLPRRVLDDPNPYRVD